jgi:hypothetical protein
MPSDDWDFKKEALRGLELERKARKLLGVEEGASRAKIKRAYRKLAKACHPDLNPGDEDCHQRFMLVAEAYDILTKRSSPIHRYLLPSAQGVASTPLTEEDYREWWCDRFRDLI